MIHSLQNTTVSLTNLPDIRTVKFEKIDKNYLKVLLINVLLVFVPLFVGLFFFIDPTWLQNSSIRIPLLYSAFFTIFILVVLFLVGGFHKRKYLLRDHDLSYRSGLLIKTIVTVPFSRIQHIEIDQGFLSRFFGLASLSVFTAGDSSHDLEISGIKNDHALKIKEFISTKINESQ